MLKESLKSEASIEIPPLAQLTALPNKAPTPAEAIVERDPEYVSPDTSAPKPAGTKAPAA